MLNNVGLVLKLCNRQGAGPPASAFCGQDFVA